jgi:hypothetical protein
VNDPDETELSVEEFKRRVAASFADLDAGELENIEQLVRWFTRRYPTAKERLAYARRKYAEWTRTRVRR